MRHFFERLVAPLLPSALFVYAGDNDVGNGASADDVIDLNQSLLYKIDQHLPGIRIYLLSIKPSPFRRDQMDQINVINRSLEELAAARPNTQFVDIFSPMLRPDGEPDPALFSEDMLHMNAEGYARWTTVLRPFARALEAANQGGPIF